MCLFQAPEIKLKPKRYQVVDLTHVTQHEMFTLSRHLFHIALRGSHCGFSTADCRALDVSITSQSTSLTTDYVKVLRVICEYSTTAFRLWVKLWVLFSLLLLLNVEISDVCTEVRRDETLLSVFTMESLHGRMHIAGLRCHYLLLCPPLKCLFNMAKSILLEESERSKDRFFLHRVSIELRSSLPTMILWISRRKGI